MDHPAQQPGSQRGTRCSHNSKMHWSNQQLQNSICQQQAQQKSLKDLEEKQHRERLQLHARIQAANAKLVEARKMEAAAAKAKMDYQKIIAGQATSNTTTGSFTNYHLWYEQSAAGRYRR